jgi:hypothetical protein
LNEARSSARLTDLCRAATLGLLLIASVGTCDADDGSDVACERDAESCDTDAAGAEGDVGTDCPAPGWQVFPGTPCSVSSTLVCVVTWGDCACNGSIGPAETHTFRCVDGRWQDEGGGGCPTCPPPTSSDGGDASSDAEDASAGDAGGEDPFDVNGEALSEAGAD